MPDLSFIIRDLDQKGVPIDKQLETLRSQYEGFDNADTEGYLKYRDSIGLPAQNIKIPGADTGAITDKSRIVKDVPRHIKVLESIRPFLTAGADVLGTGVGTAVTKSPAIGKATGAATSIAADQIVQALEGDFRQPAIIEKMTGTEGSATGRVLNAGQMYAENVIGGKLFEGIAKTVKGGVKELLKPGSVADPGLVETGATYSMYGNHPIAKFIEDTFAPGAKKEALQNSATRTREMANTLSSNITGRTETVTTSRMKLGERARSAVMGQMKLSRAESDTLANKAKNIASNYIVKVPKTVKQVPGTAPIAGGTVNPAMPGTSATTQTIYEDVAGPIEIRETLEAAKRFAMENKKTGLKPDENDQFLSKVSDLVEFTGAQFDSKGNLISVNAIPFENAWQLSQALNDLGWPTEKLGNVTFVDKRFRALATAVRNDIGSSIATWKTPNPADAAEALRTFRLSKATVEQRNTLFDATESSIPKLLDTAVDAHPEIDRILSGKHEKDLQRALDIGRMVLPSGTIVSTNMRKDLEGYELQKIVKSAWTQTDPSDATKGFFDKDKLMAAFTDPNKKDTYGILFSAQTRKDVEQFFRTVSAVSQKQSEAGKYAINSRVGYAGITLGAGLVTSALGGNASSSMLIAGGVLGGRVGLNVLGKWLSNPKKARVLTAMVQGAPLTMSQKAASRLLFSGMQGTRLTLTTADQMEITGQINADGQIEIQ